MKERENEGDPNLIRHANGSVEDVDAEKPSVVRSLLKDIGLEDDFVKSVIKDTAKEWVRDKMHLSRRADNKSKFGRTVETLKGMWWIPAALIITVGAAIITLKILAKLAGVDI